MIKYKITSYRNGPTRKVRWCIYDQIAEGCDTLLTAKSFKKLFKKIRAYLVEKKISSLIAQYESWYIRIYANDKEVHFDHESYHRAVDAVFSGLMRGASITAGP